MQIKVSDYIIKFLIQKQIKTIFGYPGGVVCHLIDSVRKFDDKISIKLNYHEQASSFAACSYALASGNMGAVIATSGPGALNLVTGIANAWFDSIPVIFITGQVDTYMQKGKLKIRQSGFQETDIVQIVKPITKYAVKIDKADNIKYELEKAYSLALNGRKGPVLIDVPADIQRAFIDEENLKGYKIKEIKKDFSAKNVFKLLNNAKRPIILAGAGAKHKSSKKLLNKFIEKWQIPFVTSMSAFDIFEYDNPFNLGFIGTNGHRYANISLAKADLILSLGNRLDIKQTGNKRNIIPEYKTLIRVEIDKEELKHKLLKNETGINIDVKEFLEKMLEFKPDFIKRDKNWNLITGKIKSCLEFKNDTEEAHIFLRKISAFAPEDFQYTLDVGQNEVWAAQALEIKKGQNVFMSAGLGAMGYSLPASIGVYEALKKPVIMISGDGGMQMNLQELEYISKNNVPVLMIVLNNRALGMIRHFQEKNFNSNFYLTTKDTGYYAPDFEKIAFSYGIEYKKIVNKEQIDGTIFEIKKPKLVEILLRENTCLIPNFGKEILYKQEPLMDENSFIELMKL